MRPWRSPPPPFPTDTARGVFSPQAFTAGSKTCGFPGTFGVVGQSPPKIIVLILTPHDGQEASCGPAGRWERQGRGAKHRRPTAADGQLVKLSRAHGSERRRRSAGRRGRRGENLSVDASPQDRAARCERVRQRAGLPRTGGGRRDHPHSSDGGQLRAARGGLERGVGRQHTRHGRAAVTGLVAVLAEREPVQPDALG